ncbi:unnamed protein product [Lymnaea stagnalis]|uniref:Uncharacterized protein n=1 Tax=Lymnaea stagnalis TaxID=6523 RepID=A0AAV2H2G6_LYMST
MENKARREEILRAKLSKLAQLTKNTNGEHVAGHTDQQVQETPVEGAMDENAMATTNDTDETPTDHLSSCLYTKLDIGQIKSIGARMKRNRAINSTTPLVYLLEVKSLSSMLNSGREVMTTTYSPDIGCCLRTSAYFPFFETKKYILDISLDLCQVGRDVPLSDFFQTSVKIVVLDQMMSGLDWLVADEAGVFHLPSHRDFGWLEVASVSLDWYAILQNQLFLPAQDAITFKFEVTHHNSKGTLIPPEVPPKGEDSDESSDSSVSSSDEDDEGVVTRGSVPRGLIFHSSYIFPVNQVTLVNLLNSDQEEWFPLIDVSETWYLKFLGHSVRAVLVFGERGSVEIFLDYFHGSCDSNLPECAIFSCQVHVIHPSTKKSGRRLGGSMQLFDMSVEQCAHWPDNYVCSADADKLRKNGFSANDKIMLRFDFFA